MEFQPYSFCLHCDVEDDLTLFIEYCDYPFVDSYLDREDKNKIGVYYCPYCKTWAVDDDW